MRKLTVRLSDDCAEVIDQFCSVNGITFTAWCEAAVIVYGPMMAKGPIENMTAKDHRTWPALPKMILRAREIDRSRRSRRGGSDGS